MLRRILEKRTRFEMNHWENVRRLMPRGRKTRGIQYDVLEFLFEHLNQKISEEELRDHLIELRGKLQPTGDPVKTAINQAVKELQRLRDPIFELVKIQETDETGARRRYVRLNFTKYEAVVTHRAFVEYLTDVLRDEHSVHVRGMTHFISYGDGLLFPGVGKDVLDLSSAQILTRIGRRQPRLDQVTFRYLPWSPGNYHFLLVYEFEDADVPFLGFVSNGTPSMPAEQSRYIVYRGETKLNKLVFLHRLWLRLYNQSFSPAEVTELQKKAANLVAQAGELSLDQTALTNALMLQDPRSDLHLGDVPE